MNKFFMILIFGFLAACAKPSSSVTAQLVPGSDPKNDQANEANVDSMTDGFWCQLDATGEDYLVVWEFDKKTKTGKYAKKGDDSFMRWKDVKWDLAGMKLTITAPKGTPILYTKMVEFKNDEERAKILMIWTDMPAAAPENITAASTAPVTKPMTFIACDKN